jgi:phosphonoacetaldehyde methylase
MKKARVLLISPNLKGMNDGINRVQPSLGLMLIGQMLENCGHIVKIHDTGLEGWNNKKLIDPKKNKVQIGQSDEDIEKVISNFFPDVVAISVLFSNFLDSAHNIARLAKKVNKNIKVVLGGNHISNSVIDYNFSLIDKNSNLPGKIEDLENENIDFAIKGEGEMPMVKLVEAIINDGDINKVSSLVRKIGQKRYFINSKLEKHNLNLLPRPARHLVNMEGYFKIGAFQSAKARSNRVLSVQCSRGCPEKCTFCTTPQMWGTKVRWRSSEHIMNEIINDARDYKIGEIQFLDDTLTAHKKNLYSLCAELEKLGIPWCTPNGTKVNYHLKNQLDMYKKMSDSGCYQITLACESGVQRVLNNLINKRLELEAVYPAIENAKKAGMLVHTFWILGYPGETYEEMKKTIDFAMNSGADSFSFAILSPLPGTPIYRKVIKENLWWNNRSMDDMSHRSSLIKVDGFAEPDEFEKFVNETNIKANLLLKEKDPERFKYKYGDKTGDRNFQRQT